MFLLGLAWIPFIKYDERIASEFLLHEPDIHIEPKYHGNQEIHWNEKKRAIGNCIICI